MSKLPTIIRTVLPWASSSVDNRQQRNQFGSDRDVDVYRPRQALDVEARDRGLSRYERQLIAEVGRLQGENDAYREQAQRKHEMALVYAKERQENARRKHRRQLLRTRMRTLLIVCAIGGFVAIILIIVHG